MFHNRKNLAARSFYINLENNRFMLSCTRNEFKTDDVPKIFSEVMDGNFVLSIEKGADESLVQRFEESLNALHHEEEVRQAFDIFQKGQVYRPYTQ